MVRDRLLARLGRVAEQQPATVGPALDLAARDQLTERGGHGRAAGADHAGERAVRKPQAHDHAARSHAAPALGEAPQQCKKPVIHAREVGDRLHHDQPLRAAGGALDERGEDLRPLRGAHGQRLVDHREPDRAQRAPLDGARQQYLGVPVIPGAKQVTWPEQLGARVVADDRLPDQQAVEHEQTNRVRPAGKRTSGRPWAARNVDRPREQALADLTHPTWVQPTRELGVCLQELN